MKRPSSLGLRLIATAFAWVAATLVVAGLLLSFLFREHIEERFDTQLRDHLDHLVSAIVFDPEGKLTLTWRPPDPCFREPGSGRYWEIRGPAGPLIRSESLGDGRLAVADPPAGVAQLDTEVAGPAGETLRAMSRRVEVPIKGVPLTVVVAGSGDDIEADVQVFGTKVSLTLAVFGLGLLLAVWFQVLVGLRPLYAMREALGDIRRGEAERLVGNYPREIEPLAHELNALLAHNAELLERARTQAANLAHALKNPLTVIRNEARQVEGEAAGVIREQALVMARSIDRYLPQARAAGSARSLGARADVHAILEDLRFSLERLYRDRNLQIQLNGLRGCRYRGEAEDLEEMLGNLLDNACKWARKRIEVHGECDGQGLSILIDDDGPGIPKQRLAEVLKRGQRLDETKPGSGLGLDIVQDIAGLYHGSLSLERSPTGGVRARLHLPAAPD